MSHPTSIFALSHHVHEAVARVREREQPDGIDTDLGVIRPKTSNFHVRQHRIHHQPLLEGSPPSSPPNGQRSPAAAHGPTGGRLVQRVLDRRASSLRITRIADRFEDFTPLQDILSTISPRARSPTVCRESHRRPGPPITTSPRWCRDHRFPDEIHCNGVS